MASRNAAPRWRTRGGLGSEEDLIDDRRTRYSAPAYLRDWIPQCEFAVSQAVSGYEAEHRIVLVDFAFAAIEIPSPSQFL